MDIAEFYRALAQIIGQDNVDLYSRHYGSPEESFLNEIYNYEALAFYTYTTKMGWFQIINEQLWSRRPSPAVQTFARVLNSGLSKLPSYSARGGIVYRGLRADDVENFVARYYSGAIVAFLGFTSATFHAPAAFGGNVFFTIRSLNAKVIWFVAEDYWEHEVLFPTNCRFRVIETEMREVISAGEREVRFFVSLQEV